MQCITDARWEKTRNVPNRLTHSGWGHLCLSRVQAHQTFLHTAELLIKVNSAGNQGHDNDDHSDNGTTPPDAYGNSITTRLENVCRIAGGLLPAGSGIVTIPLMWSKLLGNLIPDPGRWRNTIFCHYLLQSVFCCRDLCIQFRIQTTHMLEQLRFFIRSQSQQAGFDNTTFYVVM